MRRLLFLRLDKSSIYSGQAIAQTIAGHLVDFWLFFLVFSLIPLKDNAQTLFFLRVRTRTFEVFAGCRSVCAEIAEFLSFAFSEGHLGFRLRDTNPRNFFVRDFFFRIFAEFPYG